MAAANETNNDLVGLPVNLREDHLRLLGMLHPAFHEAVNSSAADVVPSMSNCRWISVDTSGIIKFDYTDHFGTTQTQVMVLTQGIPVRWRNVTKVYRYYVGTTACTAKVYTDAGASVVGLKLAR